ncbi:MAG: hypothetical protein HQK76_15415 [Desulfobacterales bacterium]|nr:hypothetical protein [Desulfobacterales bacterium]
MMNLAQLKSNRDVLNNIDWNMTHEDAVTLYLEWGNNWARSNYVIRSKDDFSNYFVINTWDNEPLIYLIRRNSDDAVELARIEMPKDLKEKFLKSIGYNKGVYSIDGEVKSWLKKELS